MTKLIELVRPLPEARTVAFFSYGEALYGGPDIMPRRARILEQRYSEAAIPVVASRDGAGQPLPEV